MSSRPRRTHLPSRTRTGLAVAAVGALAVSGLALTPAPARAADGVVLLSQLRPEQQASTRYDGADDEIRLTAQLPDPAATIAFEWNPNPNATAASGGWTAITGTPVVTGDIATLRWDGAGAVGDTVAIRAVSTFNGSTTSSTRRNVTVSGSAPSAQIGPGFSLSPPPGSNPDYSTSGYFEQPYADSGRTAATLVMTGTTSATSGTVPVSWWNGTSFTGTKNAAVTAAPLKAPDPSSPPPSFTYVDGGRWETVLDIHAFDPDQGDVLPVAARRGSDDVVPVELYEQVVDEIRSNYEGTPVRPGESATIELRVEDPFNTGIAGAEIRRQSDGSLAGYTDPYGFLRLKQAGGTTENYYVNTTDANPYEAGTDLATGDVAVPTYDPAPTYAGAVSGDGGRWDVDEYRPGDLYVQVLDQQERPIAASRPVEYRLYPNNTVPPAFISGTTGANGRLTVPFNPRAAQTDWVLEARLTSQPAGEYDDQFFRKGQATLSLTPAGRVTRPVGGRVDYTGVLALGSETLGRRRVTITFRRGVEVVPGAQPDAGILVGSRRVLSRTVVTDAEGQFRFTVSDRSERPRASEIGGRVTAATANRTSSSPADVDGNPGARTTASPQFGNGQRGTARLTVSGPGNGGRDDVLTVRGPTSVARERVKIFRAAGGRLVPLTTRRLDRAGDLPRVVLDDRNGAAVTTYVVRLLPSARVRGSETRRGVS